MPDITFPSHMPPVAGVDIGGTKVAVSVADGRGVRGSLSRLQSGAKEEYRVCLRPRSRRVQLPRPRPRGKLLLQDIAYILR